MDRTIVGVSAEKIAAARSTTTRTGVRIAGMAGKISVIGKEKIWLR
ncbi:hypothetical protein [Ktedonobacter sp. SOSP1-85]|nr:hypothetical protein [Ktedonobacter sp. SOSP1-85]